MKISSTKVSYKVGLMELLFCSFLVLKLCGVIDWSWWWVTAPLWIPYSIILFVLIVAFVVAVCTNDE